MKPKRYYEIEREEDGRMQCTCDTLSHAKVEAKSLSLREKKSYLIYIVTNSYGGLLGRVINGKWQTWEKVLFPIEEGK